MMKNSNSSPPFNDFFVQDTVFCFKVNELCSVLKNEKYSGRQGIKLRNKKWPLFCVAASGVEESVQLTHAHGRVVKLKR